VTKIEWILWAVLQVNGVADIDPQIVIKDLRVPGLYGQTQCFRPSGGEWQCKVFIDKKRMHDSSRRRFAKWRNWQNTVLHELCHVATADEFAHHGDEWKACAKTHRVWHDKK